MTLEVFEQGSIFRAAVLESIRVNLCGLGEPLLNKHVPDFVRRCAGHAWVRHVVERLAAGREEGSGGPRSRRLPGVPQRR